MEDRSHALIAIGFLVIFGVGAALVAWWMLAPTVNRLPYLLESETSVAGLGPGSPVNYKGVQVGAVRKVQLAPDHRTVNVLVGINADFPLPEGTYATVGSSGLIGSNYVDISLGQGPGTIHTSTHSPAKLRLKPGSLMGLLGQAADIVDEVKSTLNSVQELLSSENRRQITETLADVRQASAELTKLEKAAEPSVAQLPALVTETRRTVAKAGELLANSNRLVTKVSSSMSAVGAAASSASALAAQMNQQSAPQLTALLVRLRALSEQLEGLAAELRKTPQSLVLGPARARPGPGEQRPAPGGG